MTPAGSPDGWVRLGLGVEDEVAVADGFVANGELEDPVEDQASAAGGAAVEAEHELVEVALQVRLVDRALVGAEQPAFRQGGDAVHTGQQLSGVVAAYASGPLAAPLMDVAESW